MGRYLLIGMVVFFAIFILVNRSSAKERLQNIVKEEQDRFKKLTGRAEGRILEHHWENYSNPLSAGRQHKEDSMDDSDTVFMVTYEFEVNGQTYKGHGEGSPSFSRRKTQPICYDPSDPNQNCTLYYYNGQVRK